MNFILVKNWREKIKRTDAWNSSNLSRVLNLFFFFNNYLTASNGELIQVLEKNGKIIFGWCRAGDLFEIRISCIQWSYLAHLAIKKRLKKEHDTIEVWNLARNWNISRKKNDILLSFVWQLLYHPCRNSCKDIPHFWLTSTYWMLGFTRTASYEIRLVRPSVCPSVIKFYQDWIVSFFWYCTCW